MNLQNYYIEKGEGFPMVLLHGNGESNEYFEHQIEYFAKDYRVIALDTRGHGQTARGEAPFTLEQFVEDLKRFLDGMKLEKVIMLGFSDGGNIALMFALQYPHYLKSLILNGANLNTAGVKPLIQMLTCIGYGIASAFALISRGALAKKEMLRLMTHEPNINPATLVAITIPVLVIAGNHDLIKRTHTEAIYRALPNAKLVIMEGDHFIAAKQPKEFNESVEKFLKLSDNM